MKAQKKRSVYRFHYYGDNIDNLLKLRNHLIGNICKNCGLLSSHTYTFNSSIQCCEKTNLVRIDKIGIVGINKIIQKIKKDRLKFIQTESKLNIPFVDVENDKDYLEFINNKK
jgi:hypothetical protein